MSGPYGLPGPLVRLVLIGTRVLLSTPPATTIAGWPAITEEIAKVKACWEEPQARSTVVPGVVSGQPAPKAAQRATLPACSPTWTTQPKITSSTSAGSNEFRSANPFRT